MRNKSKYGSKRLELNSNLTSYVIKLNKKTSDTDNHLSTNNRSVRSKLFLFKKKTLIIRVINMDNWYMRTLMIHDF